MILAWISGGFRLRLDLGLILLGFGLISVGFWLALIWIRLDLALDFALSLAFTKIFIHSGLS